MIFDHVGIPASDLDRSKDFFCKALAPLGIGVIMEVPGAVGLGKNKKPSLWVGENKDKQSPLHIAFVAEDRAQVRAFYQAALAAGASDNGPPGGIASHVDRNRRKNAEVLTDGKRPRLGAERHFIVHQLIVSARLSRPMTPTSARMQGGRCR